MMHIFWVLSCCASTATEEDEIIISTSHVGFDLIKVITTEENMTLVLQYYHAHCRAKIFLFHCLYMFLLFNPG